MKYLKRFNKQLTNFRDQQRLSVEEIAEFCLVDPSVARAWESVVEDVRCYPSLDNLLDLCFKTGASLEYFIDIPESDDSQQLDLPGLSFVAEGDLDKTLNQLDEELSRLMPAEEEIELLRKFRKSDKQNRELILQLIGS